MSVSVRPQPTTEVHGKIFTVTHTHTHTHHLAFISREQIITQTLSVYLHVRNLICPLKHTVCACCVCSNSHYNGHDSNILLAECYI